MEKRDPRGEDQIIRTVLSACIERGAELNKLGSRASYAKVSQAKGLYELSAFQLALFAPQILKTFNRRVGKPKLSKLGRRLRAISDKAIASGMKTLTADQISRNRKRSR